VSDALWWQRGIIYEVYPRSFADGNGDGVGDLAGLLRRIDYLAELGVTAIWLSPIFPSPMADFGYDVADYCGVDPLFGTLADLDALIAAAHARSMRVILDYVPNHTSEQHPWFVAGRSARTDPKRDWYLWRDPKPDGSPPTNWRSQFGGSAWEWDAATGQYYLHSFLREQPDLNWRNLEVRSAMYDVLRFWLRRGIDGFRVDVLWLLIKDAGYRDNPPNPAWKPGDSSYNAQLPLYTSDGAEVQQIVAEMRTVLEEFGYRVLVGEIYLPVKRLVAYYGAGLRGAQLPFNFALIQTAWNAEAIADLVREYAAALPAGAWPNWVLGNHDQKRIASRIGPAQARVAAMLLLTLRGTPTLYYGDELGLRDTAIPPDAVRDPAELRQPGIGMGRDPERTPMPWDASLSAGFTSGVPWLPLGEHAQMNVTAESADPTSMLSLYRRLIAFRQNSEVLCYGTLDRVAANGSMLSYERRLGDAACTIVLNLGREPGPLTVTARRVVLSTSSERKPGDILGGETQIAGDEGLILEETSKRPE
jgi:alpha-glucosidase